MYFLNLNKAKCSGWCALTHTHRVELNQIPFKYNTAMPSFTRLILLKFPIMLFRGQIQEGFYLAILAGGSCGRASISIK